VRKSIHLLGPAEVEALMAEMDEEEDVEEVLEEEAEEMEEND